MPVLTKTKYQPVPEGIYNLLIVNYEEKPNQRDKGQTYYKWTLRVLDTLPESYPGRGEFSVLTASTLTEKNNLSKFMVKVGAPDVEVGESFDTDSLIGHKFIGKVVIKEIAGDRESNDLGDISIHEYDAFVKRGQQQKPVKTMPKQQPASAPKTVASATNAPRLVASPKVVSQKPVVQEEVQQEETATETEEEPTEAFPE